jgi:DNA-binding transcriptional ArsR family regulator
VTNYSALDDAFQALASSTRRRVVADLSRGPASVGTLAATTDMALPSFLRHIQVLERAGCVSTAKTGRVRTCRLTPDPLDLAGDWLADQRAVWTARTDRLERFLREDDR